MLPAEDGTIGGVVLPIARAAIARELGLAAAADESAPWLGEMRATFVTLKMNGALRGCIGSLEARRNLLADVKSNAVAAAFHDPRFSGLTVREFAATSIEISLLSAPERLPAAASEAELMASLAPLVDGLILEWGGRRATFLPQVWESLPEPRHFLAELKNKAGLPRDFWSRELMVSRYRVQKWAESGAAAAPGGERRA